jgi:hypothetical protein
MIGQNAVVHIVIVIIVIMILVNTIKVTAQIQKVTNATNIGSQNVVGPRVVDEPQQQQRNKS